MHPQERFRCVIYRGGTSKAVFFMENELPTDPILKERVLLAAFGSPDLRQIDGLGGSDITTSKAAIIGPPSRSDADVDYTFGQVLLDRPSVSFQGNCGNISSAVGPFAVDEGLVRVKEGLAEVRIHNTNTKKILVARFKVENGKALVEGNFSIPGVPGTSSRIEIDYAGTVGSATGKLLPTGHPVDELEVQGVGTIPVSVVDVANPVVFVKAEDIGATGKEYREQINTNQELMERLEHVRAAGAEAAGMISDRSRARLDSPLAPQVAFVRSPVDYVDYHSGETIKAENVSFLSRVIFNQMAVESYTGTGSICTAAAAMIEGTLVNKVASDATKASGRVRIGHARGIMELSATAEKGSDGWHLTKALIQRTARRIMEGYVFVQRSRLES